MPLPQNSDREPPPLQQTFLIFPGQTENGWKSERREIRKNLPCPYMKYIWAPGNVATVRKITALSTTSKQENSWQSTATIWAIPMWN